MTMWFIEFRTKDGWEPTVIGGKKKPTLEVLKLRTGGHKAIEMREPREIPKELMHLTIAQLAEKWM